MSVSDAEYFLSIRYHLSQVLKYDPLKMLLSSLLTAAGSLLMTVYTSYFLTHLYNLQITAVCGLGMAFYSTVLFSYLNDTRLKNIMMKWQSDTLPKVWRHILSLPYQIITRYQSGDLLQRLYDYETAITQSVTLFLQMIINLAALILIISYLFYCSPRLAAILLLMTSFLHALKIVMIPVNSRHLKDGLVHKGRLTQFLQELLLQIHKIRSSRSEEIVQQRWYQLYIEMKMTALQSFKIELCWGLIDVVMPLLFAMSLYTGLLLSGGQSSYTVLQFMLTATQFLIFTDKFSRQLMNFLIQKANLRRLETLLTVPTEPHDEAITLLRPLQGCIEIRNVFLRHPDQIHYLLEDVSITIPAGKFVAIIGPSGAGKSTLFKLLLGLIHPESGSILIDNLPLQRYNQRDLRKQISAVLQTSQLQPGTIIANLSAHANVTHTEAWRLAELVGLDQDIKAMPMQMHTFISDNAGESLSGGQKQKLLIARALASKPRILLLDEATSALDNSSQQLIFQHLRTLNITRLVIAHRYSTIAAADYIYCISPMNKISPVTLSNITNING